jgi:hypothetical protein
MLMAGKYGSREKNRIPFVSPAPTFQASAVEREGAEQKKLRERCLPLARAGCGRDTQASWLHLPAVFVRKIGSLEYSLWWTAVTQRTEMNRGG